MVSRAAVFLDDPAPPVLGLLYEWPTIVLVKLEKGRVESLNQAPPLGRAAVSGRVSAVLHPGFGGDIAHTEVKECHAGAHRTALVHFLTRSTPSPTTAAENHSR
eukprot:21513-Eustigmatos_ZCMA.PRE.1